MLLWGHVCIVRMHRADYRPIPQSYSPHQSDAGDTGTEIRQVLLSRYLLSETKQEQVLLQTRMLSSIIASLS